MTVSTSAAAGLVSELTAITCPVDRAVAASRIAEDFGNLPPAIARIRREALQEARDAGHRVVKVAERTGISARRIYQLTITKRRGRQVGTRNCQESVACAQTAAPQTTQTIAGQEG